MVYPILNNIYLGNFKISVIFFLVASLTDDIDVPKNRDAAEMDSEIPITYVPARNTIFLSIAASYAEKYLIRDIFIGVNAIDYSGYPDCRPEFINAYEKMINMGTRAGSEGHAFKIHTPLINLSKSEIISIGSGLNVNYRDCLLYTSPSPRD